ncbi:MAG: hypothetical protein K2O06_06065 [Acetatifactor sp.]|nr:hypothetical protein [Acetatifactor sp.]
MDEFRKKYRQAVDEILPELHMDAERIRDELHHRRMRQRQRNRMLVKGAASAAAVFLVFGAGTAAAKNYRNSVIEMQENGYSITSMDAYAGTCAGGVPESGVDLAMERGRAAPQECEGIVEIYDIQSVEYNSLEEFSNHETVAVALPDFALFPAVFQEENILVLNGGEHLTITLRAGERYCFLRQFDHRKCDSYASTTSFSGENANERNLVTDQGMCFKVFDTLSEDGSLESIHAVISVNGRDLALDFRGFETGVVEQVLTAMDLSVYFTD